MQHSAEKLASEAETAFAHRSRVDAISAIVTSRQIAPTAIIGLLTILPRPACSERPEPPKQSFWFPARNRRLTLPKGKA